MGRLFQAFCAGAAISGWCVAVLADRPILAVAAGLMAIASVIRT